MFQLMLSADGTFPILRDSGNLSPGALFLLGHYLMKAWPAVRKGRFPFVRVKEREAAHIAGGYRAACEALEELKDGGYLIEAPGRNCEPLYCFVNVWHRNLDADQSDFAAAFPAEEV